MSLAIKVSKQAARGDPGLFSGLANIAKGVVSGIKTVGGVASRLPIPVVSQVGALAHNIADVIDGPDDQMFQGPGVLSPIPLPQQRTATGTIQLGQNGVSGSIEASPGEIAQAAQAIQQQTGGQMTMKPNGHVCSTKGMHMNKTSYFLKDGTFIPAGTRCVSNRRMNPFNPRAVRRSIRRLKGAKRMKDALAGITIRDACK